MSWVPETYWYTDELGNQVQGTRHVWVEDGLHAVQPAGYTAPATSTTTQERAVATATRADQAEALRQVSADEEQARQAQAREAALAAQRAAAAAMWAELADQTKQALGPRRADTAEGDSGAAARASLEAERQRQKDLAAKLHFRQKQDIADQITISQVDAGDATKLTSLEEIIKRQLADQKASNGNDLNPDIVSSAVKSYTAAVGKVSARYNSFVDQLRAFFVLDPNGNLVRPKDEASRVAAMKLYQSAEFKQAEADYLRLANGAYEETLKAYDEIAVNQRQYLYNAAHQYVLNEADRLRGDGQGAEADALLKAWEVGGQYDYEYAKSLVDPASTSIKEWVWRSDPGGGGHVVPVYRTVDEEVAVRREQYRAEIERQRAELERQRMLENVSGRLASPTGSMSSQEAEDDQLIADALRANGLDSVKTAQQAKRVVDAAMVAWEDRNRRLFLSGATQDAMASGDPVAVRKAAVNEDNVAFQEARKKAEIRLYALLGSKEPDFLDSVGGALSLDNPLFAVISALGGSIGAGVKGVLSAASGAPAQLALDPYGGVTIESFPPELQAKYRAEAEARVARETGLADYLRPAAIQAELRDILLNEGVAWLKGGGRQWQQEHNVRLPEVGVSTGTTPADKQRMAEELRRFADQFYSGKDPVRALAEFGQTPFSPHGPGDALNLAAAFLLDPTNAIPLKATTWLPRAKFAIEMTKSVEGAKRVALGAKKWLTATETDLRIWKYADEVAKKLNSGVTGEELTADLLRRLAGLNKKSEVDVAVEAWRREAGIDARLVNADELVSLVQDQVVRGLKDRGIPFETMVDALKKADAEAKAKLAAETAQREQRLAEGGVDAIRAGDRAREAATAVVHQEARAAAQAEKASRVAEAESRSATRRPAVVTRRTAAAADPDLRDPYHPAGPAGDPPRQDPYHPAAAHPDPLRTPEGAPRPVPGIRSVDLEADAKLFDRHRSLGGPVVPDAAKAVSYEGKRVTILEDALSPDEMRHEAQAGTSIHGVEFASAAHLERFAASDEGKRILALVKRNPSRGLLELYEAGRASIRHAALRAEGGKTLRLENGKVVFQTIFGKRIPAVVRRLGGELSSQMYLPTARDEALRAGARTPDARRAIEHDVTRMEKLKKQATSVAKALRDGRLTQAEADAEFAKIRAWGLEWEGGDFAQAYVLGKVELVDRPRVTRLDASDLGEKVFESDLGGHGRNWVPVGDLIVEDVLGGPLAADGTSKALAAYYRTFSLLDGAADEAKDGLLALVQDPGFRASAFQVGKDAYKRKFSVKWFLDGFIDAPAGVRDFRERGRALFELFHLTRLDDAEHGRDLLALWSEEIHRRLADDPDNPFWRMWAVMEVRSGWTKTGFRFAEESFLRAVVASESGLHPGLALAMIPYGPLARPGQVRFGLPPALAGMLDGGRYFRVPRLDMVEAEAKRLLERIGKGLWDREAPERIMQAPSVLIQFLMRDDLIVRRAAFEFERAGFNVEASLRAGKSAAWRAARDTDARRKAAWGAMADGWKAFETALGGLSLDLRGRAREVARQRLYDEMYWAREVTHDNYALHTYNFYAKMAEPRNQRGWTWRRYAETYLYHMDIAGRLEEGQRVVLELYAQDLAKVRADWRPGSTNKSVRFWEDVGVEFDAARWEAQRAAESAQLSREAAREVSHVEREGWFADDPVLAGRGIERHGGYANLDDEVLDRITASGEALVGFEKKLQMVEVPASAAAAAKLFRRVARKEGIEAARRAVAKEFDDGVAKFVMYDEARKARIGELRRDLAAFSHAIVEGAPVAGIQPALFDAIDALKRTEDGRDALRSLSPEVWRLVEGVRSEEYLAFGRTELEAAAVRYAEDSPDAIAANRAARADRERPPRVADETVIKAGPPGGVPAGELAPGAAKVPEPPATAAAADAKGFLDNLKSIPVGPNVDPFEFATRADHLGAYAQRLSGMSELDWYKREIYREERRVLKATDKQPIIRRLNRLRMAKRALEVSMSSGRYTTPTSRVALVRRVVGEVLDRAVASYPARRVSARVRSREAVLIERARDEHVLLTTMIPGGSGPALSVLDEVSETYKTHGAAIENLLSTFVGRRWLQRALRTQDWELPNFQVSLGVLLNAAHDVRPANMGRDGLLDAWGVLEEQVNAQLRRITGDRTYTWQQAMADRVEHRLDHLPIDVYEAQDKVVADAEFAFRGWRATSLTRSARKPLRPMTGGGPLTFDKEYDLGQALVRSKALYDLRADGARYAEVRKVARASMIRSGVTKGLYEASLNGAKIRLRRAGLNPDDVANAARLERERSALFDTLRAVAVRREVRRKLAEVVDRSPAASADDIAAEFESLYGQHNPASGLATQSMTPFQQRTLEEAFRVHTGGADPHDPAAVRYALAREGTAPPDWSDKAAVRKWLIDEGVWNPRTGERILKQGEASWDIYAEADYYRSNWAYVPDWADPSLLEPGGRLEAILDDQSLYVEQMRRWGVFKEAAGVKGLSREELLTAQIYGDPSLDIKARRDLASQRQFMIARLGPIVTDDGVTLKRLPWLMTAKEHRAYFARRAARAIGKDLVQNERELAILEARIVAHVEAYWDSFMKRSGGAPQWEDVFRLTADIVRDLAKDPSWTTRWRDRLVGKPLHFWTALQHTLVFTQIGFLTTNVFDVAIKEPWMRFTRRAYMADEVSEAAASKTLADFNFERTASLFKDVELKGTERMKDAWRRRAVTGDPALVRSLAQAVAEVPAEGASMAELGSKLRLAQRMYDPVFQHFVAGVAKGDAKLADAMARDFISKEVLAAWPTVGDGPIERLVNQLFPFFSYQFKNRVFYVGELANHPALYNYLNAIGDRVERWNRERWEREHPDEVLSPAEARRFELPWAPGVFVDLGSFSDVQRAWKPVYALASGEPMSAVDFASYFVRLVSPSQQNIIAGIANAWHLAPRYQWQPVYVGGRFTGEYRQVEVPWEAPWGGPADWRNSFWPLEQWAGWQKAFGDGVLTPQEASVLMFQGLFFGGAKQHDRGAGLNLFYWQLRNANPKAARDFLETEAGGELLAYWMTKRTNTQEAFLPADVAALLESDRYDPYAWFHERTPEYQAAVQADWDALAAIRSRWDAVIWKLTPGTPEYREAKLRAQLDRYEFYRTHPELYEAEAASMTDAKWRETLDAWKVDDLLDSYYRIEAPRPADFKDPSAYLAAKQAWLAQRQAFLQAFPQVAQRLAETRGALDQAWTDTEQGWFEILDRIGVRKIAAKAAQEAGDFALADQLYLVNQLEYNKLSMENAVFYFDPTTDFKTLPPGVRADEFRGRPLLADNLLPRVKVFNDFNAWRFSRMSDEEKALFERDQKYASAMKDVVAGAKVSDNFGAAFVAGVKADPWLREEYFRRNPGKREQWAANDEYIAKVSRFGELMKAGDFSRARSYFDALPDWIKARYYEKHPDQKARVQENLEYMGYMEKWVAFYKRRDYAGGAAYFDGLPQWVKDRYAASHEGTPTGTSDYAKAMGEWVGLLRAGRKAEAKAYFDALPQAFKDRYYEKHPQQKLMTDIVRVGQLVHYFGSDDANRGVYLAEHPEFAAWLRDYMVDEDKRRIAIMAAYLSIPKSDQWLLRVFRERYPEVFSKEAKGQQRIARVTRELAEHPELSAPMQTWMTSVMATFAEMLKHAGSRPRPLEIKRVKRSDRGRSAAWVRIHS